MRTWHVVIDIAECEDCNNCLLACKDEHVENTWTGYAAPQPKHGHRWIDIMRAERGQFPLLDVAYRPTMCMHCDDAPCMKASPGAVYKREDGIVIIDPNKAKGQKDLVKSCPYHMIFWNEAEQTPQKCTLCAHLLDEGWKQPRCVQACPTGALRVQYVEDSEFARTVKAEQLEVLHPELNSVPRVYYKNMYRYTKCFIAGSVAVQKDGVVDCAAGVRVTLLQGKQKIGEAVTDTFGDFKFDRLEPGSSNYVIEIQAAGYEKETIAVERLKTSLTLGTINLDAATGRASVATSPAQ